MQGGARTLITLLFVSCTIIDGIKHRMFNSKWEYIIVVVLHCNVTGKIKIWFWQSFIRFNTIYYDWVVTCFWVTLYTRLQWLHSMAEKKYSRFVLNIDWSIQNNAIRQRCLDLWHLFMFYFNCELTKNSIFNNWVPPWVMRGGSAFTLPATSLL